jgi:hypothetical protein
MIKAALIAGIAPLVLALLLGLIEHFNRPKIRTHLGAIDPGAPSPDAHVERDAAPEP